MSFIITKISGSVNLILTIFSPGQKFDNLKLNLNKIKMEKIVNMVAQKAGISTEQAETAVRTVVNFLKDKLPPGLAG